jgi:hypothetical protein
VYFGNISDRRRHVLADILGFSIRTIPFIYLGIPIFKGKPKVCYLQAIADKIRSKLYAWKASLLSMAGRAELVKSIVHNMLLYNFHIYQWPASLLAIVDRWTRNFIWSGDVEKR